MKKQISEFDYTKFQSGLYEVTTSSGIPVYIAGLITEGTLDLIIGKCDGRLLQWDENGTILGSHVNSSFNLVLIEKPKKMIVSVIRSRKGQISARVTEYAPYTQVGNEMLAQYEFEVLSGNYQF